VGFLRLQVCSRRSKFERNTRYRVFDSGAYRNHAAEWLFPQEKAAFLMASMAICDSKTLLEGAIVEK
jgi:hypothetical protein